MTDRLTVIGGGLAGCEAAWQAANAGVDVDLYEMRPQRSGPAHQTGRLAELVCSNSLRGAALENAVGLLKEELARLDSVIVDAARAKQRFRPAARWPSTASVSPMRSRHVSPRIRGSRCIAKKRTAIPLDRPTIVACGPLPNEAFLASLDALVGKRLAYFDAASPIVAADSIDESLRCTASRATKRATATTISTSRSTASNMRSSCTTCARSSAISPKTSKRGGKYFEGCLPVEEMADRGDDTLRFGPLKPVGLRDPRTGTTPHAVVQLRKENAEGTAFNLVGFQTRLSWPAQKEAFGKLPGLANAEWLRLGVMHRNTFIDSPRLLDARLRLRGHDALYFAGQITGAEGYVEAAACGAMTRHPRGARNPRTRSDRVSARERVRRGRRASAEHRDARLPAGQRDLGLFSAARATRSR